MRGTLTNNQTNINFTENSNQIQKYLYSVYFECVHKSRTIYYKVHKTKSFKWSLGRFFWKFLT